MGELLQQSSTPIQGRRVGGRRGEGRDEGIEGCLRLGIKGRSVGGQEGLPGARVSWREH